jgi:hypothetical protein
MIDAAVLAALADAVDRGGDLDRALAEIGRVDPLLRGTVRRRLRAAHADALLAGPVNGPGAEGHALRLAYLMVARAIPPRAARRDVAAVEAVFAEARAARAAGGRALWWPSAIVGLSLLGAAAGIGAAARASGPPSARAVADAGPSATAPAPEVRGAFAQGGVPAPQPGDAALARSLGTDLPAFLSALDRRSEARRAGESAAEAETEMKEAEGRALGADVRGALGAQGAEALGALVGAARAASEGKAVKGLGGFGEAAAALDDALAARGLGYFVDGDVITQGEGGRPLVLVYSYRVARVSLFTAGATTVRALHLRRLDRLNWSPTLLGFTRPTLRAAAVLLDQLEEQVVTVIAPGLAVEASLALFDPAAPPAERAVVEARAGAILREDYGALPGFDRIAAAKLGKLLGKRRALFARWTEAAEARGLGFRVPTTLRLPEGFAHAAEALASRDDREELALVQAALDDQTRLDAFAALRGALASSVERHEVQHRLDAAAPLSMPAALEARVGAPGRDGAGGRTPRVSLTLLSRFLFDRRLHGTAESYAALTALEGLGAALGAAPRTLVKDHAVDRAAVGALWMELSAQAPDRLREAAAGLWSKLFGGPLPEVRRVDAPE